MWPIITAAMERSLNCFIGFIADSGSGKATIKMEHFQRHVVKRVTIAHGEGNQANVFLPQIQLKFKLRAR